MKEVLIMEEKKCEKFRRGYTGITLNPRDNRRYAKRMNPKGYRIVRDKNGPHIDDYGDPKYYARLNDKGFEGIVKDIFDAKGYDKSLQRINKQTGYNISKEEFCLLAGYIFVDEGEDGKSLLRDVEKRPKQISYCHTAIDSSYESAEFIKFIKDKLSNCRDPIIERPHIHIKVDGNTELSFDKLLELVEMIKTEIERVEGEIERTTSQGNPR